MSDYIFVGKQLWLAPSIIGIFVLLAPLWMYISVKNKYTNHVIYQGWTPVLSAMVISRYVLDYWHILCVFCNFSMLFLAFLFCCSLSASSHLDSNPTRTYSVWEKLSGTPVSFIINEMSWQHKWKKLDRGIKLSYSILLLQSFPLLFCPSSLSLFYWGPYQCKMLQ